jgi:hypothetical protein
MEPAQDLHVAIRPDEHHVLVPRVQLVVEDRVAEPIAQRRDRGMGGTSVAAPRYGAPSAVRSGPDSSPPRPFSK